MNVSHMCYRIITTGPSKTGLGPGERKIVSRINGGRANNLHTESGVTWAWSERVNL
jgi:hypothetical protein